jgi:hypothetical protein
VIAFLGEGLFGVCYRIAEGVVWVCKKQRSVAARDYILLLKQAAAESSGVFGLLVGL